jgi:hypothetical protein
MKDYPQVIVHVQLLMIQHDYEDLLEESEKENIMITNMFYVKNIEI